MVSEIIRQNCTVQENVLILTEQNLADIQSQFDAEYVFYLRWKERYRKYKRKIKLEMTLDEIEKERKRQRDLMRKRKGIKPHNYRIKDEIPMDKNRELPGG